METKLKDIKKTLGVDTISRRNGIITVKKEFFYTFGQSEKDLVESIKNAYGNTKIVKIIDSGQRWAPFKGGATTADSSHWWVKFKL